MNGINELCNAVRKPRMQSTCIMGTGISKKSMRMLWRIVSAKRALKCSNSTR